MKCQNCGQDNKSNVKICKKCGGDMTLPPVWFPGWKWHVKTLSIIYLVLIVAFFALSRGLQKLPQPYHLRTIPAEMTPWLHPHQVPAP